MTDRCAERRQGNALTAEIVERMNGTVFLDYDDGRQFLISRSQRLVTETVGHTYIVEGLNESELRIGDRFRIGSAVLRVTQPRMPCSKLAVRFQRDDMVKRFLASGRSGFYFAVDEEGDLAAGDEIEPLARATHEVTVSEITRLYARDRGDEEALRRAAEVEDLPEDWRGFFRHRIEKLGA